MSSSSEQKPYILHTSDIAPETRGHPLDAKVNRKQIRLADLTGLTKTGVSLTRLPPHNQSSVLHWHNNDDEWIYIISAGEGGVMKIKEGDKGTRDEPLSGGDFFAFPAGSKIAHTMQAGEMEVVYLVGGSRETLDVCYYPDMKMRILVDRTATGRHWAAPESAILETPMR